MKKVTSKVFSYLLITTFCLTNVAFINAQQKSGAKARKPASTDVSSPAATSVSTPRNTEIVVPKPAPIAKVYKVGLVMPKAQLEGVSASEASEAVLNTFYELMKSKTVEVTAISARLPIQVAPEAEEKGIKYVLYSTLTQKRSRNNSGGFLGRVTGRVANTVASSIPYGRNTGEIIARDVAAETLRTASSLATTVKEKDEITLEYKFVSLDSSQNLVSNSITKKAQSNGEDIITSMIETAANEILTKLSAEKPSSTASATQLSTPTASNIEVKSPGLTMENFLKLKNGMSYEDAVKILGSNGELMMDSGESLLYNWKTSNSSSASLPVPTGVSLYFYKGKLQSKSQSGLK